MALITCPDCKKEISESAPTCPHCGRPMKPATQTIEETAKQYKIHIAASVVSMIVGVMIIYMSISKMGNISTKGAIFGAIITMIGLIWYIATKIEVWWHHG